MNDVNQRIENLREVMRREHLAAFIFPSTDPHQGEYVPDHWKGREFISGFIGSAGTAVVTMTSAALWTDSRYFIAAEEQLKGTEFQLMKLKMEGTPTISEWLGRTCGAGAEVGIDGWCSSASAVKNLIVELRKEGGITVRTNIDPLRLIWSDRPVIPENPVEIFPMAYAGESAHEKIGRIRQALRERHADGMLMAALDDIAWTLNLRGTDVHCNPVFVAYLLISSKDVTLYINQKKLTPEVMAYLKTEGVMVDSYENVTKGLNDYFEYNILLDPDEVNYALYKTVVRERVEEESPVKRMKTVKNETEIAGFRNAMLKDGIAMVKFLKWLSAYVGKPEISELSEISIDQRLKAFRAEQPLYRDISFDTIAGYGPHGAIVHYEATPETDVPLQPKGMLLLDSGAQYLDGTTDITRTIALGPLSDEEKRAYTLVLKGHIQIELCKFPSGASGTQIDILARKDMWREGLNYLHGTGHGVGTYLNVHEGPHQFRMEWKPAPLVAGMTITDEPGIYLEGKFGVRIENTLLMIPYKETAFGKFLQFESLTLCPIDKTPIVRSMLLPEEIDWLNAYHQHVFDTLSPHLDADETVWLREACAPIDSTSPLS
ncbi:Xaa-Pro aminopeptidase [Prevotella aff. ruminicola Tc2-24]|uniref:Xaa-Pro aminopeptidase n=1 Tax=Prevotella aff. ruminicola Tc2-24 TaxID=81582 RepID=A0A1I0P801_9BACT|nr:aminopeptidase P family protein [Prevotella aff. ruminicola Tc2-24]SEW10320.1 Xaa-Pro aminopeptidase [Prevotella aff. ruminicola Tc2-24]